MTIFKIQTIEDRLSQSSGDTNNMWVQIGIAIAQLLPVIFGGSQTASNNTFIDSLVSRALSLGFVGITHDDVVHLMPGNWGQDHMTAINVFNAYLNSGLKQTPGTNLVPLWSFGGGYIPDHQITWDGGTHAVNSGLINNVNGQWIPNPNIQNAGFGNLFSNPIILLALAAIAFAMFSGSKKEA